MYFGIQVLVFQRNMPCHSSDADIVVNSYTGTLFYLTTHIITQAFVWQQAEQCSPLFLFAVSWGQHLSFYSQHFVFIHHMKQAAGVCFLQSTDMLHVTDTIFIACRNSTLSFLQCTDYCLTDYPLTCCTIKKCMGADLVTNGTTIPCLLFCNQKHYVNNAYYWWQCVLLHCLAEERHRFCHN
jgi:hypothetical protein